MNRMDTASVDCRYTQYQQGVQFPWVPISFGHTVLIWASAELRILVVKFKFNTNLNLIFILGDRNLQSENLNGIDPEKRGAIKEFEPYRKKRVYYTKNILTYVMSNLMYKPVLDETSVISVIGSGNMGFSLALGFLNSLRFYSTTLLRKNRILFVAMKV